VRGDVTGADVSDLLVQVKGMRAAAMGPEELQRVRNTSLLTPPGKFDTNDTNDAITQRLGRAWSIGQGADHFAKRPGGLAAMDAAATLAAVQNQVRPETLTLVAVGDLAKIRPQLEALNLGAVEVRHSAGRKVGTNPEKS